MAGRVPTVDTIIRDDTRVLPRIPAQLWSTPVEEFPSRYEVEATLEAEYYSPLPPTWHFAFKKSPFPCFSP